MSSEKKPAGGSVGLHPIVERIWHVVLHIYALAFVCDLLESGCSEQEYERYMDFMRRHGFDGML